MLGVMDYFAHILALAAGRIEQITSAGKGAEPVLAPPKSDTSEHIADAAQFLPKPISMAKNPMPSPHMANIAMAAP